MLPRVSYDRAPSILPDDWTCWHRDCTSQSSGGTIALPVLSWTWDVVQAVRPALASPRPLTNQNKPASWPVEIQTTS